MLSATLVRSFVTFWHLPEDAGESRVRQEGSAIMDLQLIWKG